MKKYKPINKTFFIKIANCVVKIDYTHKTRVLPFLTDFFIPICKKCNFNIRFENNQINFSQKVYKKNLVLLPQNINIYAFQYFLRNILQNFLGKNKSGFFLHCSGISIGNKAYLFMGQQRSGKSTISKILSDIVPVLADDSGIIAKAKESDNFYFYQTPFVEKNKFKKTIKKFYINKIFFISKSKVCKEKKILNKKEVLNLLVKQLWTDKKRLHIQLEILMQFVNGFNQFYSLDFPKDKEAVIGWFRRFTQLSTSSYVRARLQQSNCDNRL